MLLCNLFLIPFLKTGFPFLTPKEKDFVYNLFSVNKICFGIWLG